MLNIDEIKGLSPKTKAEIFSTLQDDPEVMEYLLTEPQPDWLSRELENREIAFLNGSLNATSREDLNKRLAEKWNEKKAD
jgi:hypothetical protein